MFGKQIFILLTLTFVSTAPKESYNDWKNRGLKGRVKTIEQNFYNNLRFEDNAWVLDSSKIYLKSKLIFDASGNIGIQIKDIKTHEGWQRLEYIYDYENNVLKSYSCISGKAKVIETCVYTWVNPYQLESRASLANYQFVNETLYLNKDFRAYKTIRRHYKKDKIEVEELIEDEYNEKNEIMKTNLKHTSIINPKKSQTNEIKNAYRIYERDHQENWTSMDVRMSKDDRLFYFTTRRIEYY